MQYYAFRAGFGSEGHGRPLFVASASSLEDCQERAKAQLQDEFGGLWPGKLRDTWIGSLSFIAKSGKWSRSELQTALDDRLLFG